MADKVKDKVKIMITLFFTCCPKVNNYTHIVLIGERRKCHLEDCSIFCFCVFFSFFFLRCKIPLSLHHNTFVGPCPLSKVCKIKDIWKVRRKASKNSTRKPSNTLQISLWDKMECARGDGRYGQSSPKSPYRPFSCGTRKCLINKNE